jgi:hypothetical protein
MVAEEVAFLLEEAALSGHVEAFQRFVLFIQALQGLFHQQM